MCRDFVQPLLWTGRRTVLADHLERAVQKLPFPRRIYFYRVVGTRARSLERGRAGEETRTPGSIAATEPTLASGRGWADGARRSGKLPRSFAPSELPDEERTKGGPAAADTLSLVAR